MRVDRKHGMQLRLRSGLKADVVLVAVADYLLNHLTHLVDLDRIDHEVLSLVVVFLRSHAEATGNLADAVVEYIGETEQQRSGDVAQLKLIHYVADVDRNASFTRGNLHVSTFIDREILQSPSGDVVKLRGILNSPFSHILLSGL